MSGSAGIILSEVSAPEHYVEQGIRSRPSGLGRKHVRPQPEIFRHEAVQQSAPSCNPRTGTHVPELAAVKAFRIGGASHSRIAYLPQPYSFAYGMLEHMGVQHQKVHFRGRDEHNGRCPRQPVQPERLLMFNPLQIFYLIFGPLSQN